jgi:hypothetical protein
MSTPLDKALTRLAELQREVSELKQFIEMYQKLEGVPNLALEPSKSASPGHELTGNNTRSYANQPGDNQRKPARKDRLPGASPREIAEIMERVIREAGRPLSRGEIVEALERRDVEIPAKDKPRYVGTIAWRNKGTFLNIDGRGYWLRNVPLASKTPIPAESFSDPPEEHSEDLFED